MAWATISDTLNVGNRRLFGRSFIRRTTQNLPLTKRQLATTPMQMKFCLPLIALALCSGCATTSLTRPVIAHFPVRSFYPDIMLTALARGRLIVRNGCVRIVGTNGGEGDLVIWPKDSQLITEGRNQVIVVGGSDERLRVGSRVQLGGGGSDSVENEGLTAPLPTGCSGPYFHAN